MTSEQAFQILGIKDHNIDEASLKKAFHSAARKTHPDSNPDDESAKAKFHQINEAYEVLREYLKYEKKQSAEAGSRREAADRRGTADGSEAANNKTAEEKKKAAEKDIWEAYTKADQKYAQQRHKEASRKAEQTIRNHARHEKARMEQEKEQGQNQKKQQTQEKQREHSYNTRQHEKTKEAGQRQKNSLLFLEEILSVTGRFLKNWIEGFWKSLATFAETHITGNEKRRRILIGALLAVILVWAGFEIAGGAYSIRYITSVLAQIAKWILLIWIAYRITRIVHTSWKNQLLSVFAFLISMELEITIANWIEDLIRSI